MSTVDVIAQVRTQVGPQVALANGTQSQYLRAGNNGELTVGDAHCKYYEAVSRGRCFCASNQSVITFGTSLTATAVTYTLYNPIGSNVNLVLLQTGLTLVTYGTAGSIVYAANVLNTAAAPATNTAIAVRNAKLDGGAGLAQVYSATTLPAAPVAIRTLAYGITAAGVGAITDYVDGAISLGPNTAVTVQGITTVGTGLISMLWEEVPLS